MENYKRIDEKISNGYKLLSKGQVNEGCDTWLDAWEDIKNVMNIDKIKDLPTLQEKYKWSEFVMNYVQDLDEQLHNLAMEEPHYHSRRIKYCEELLELSGDQDELIVENTRRSIAESHYALGNKQECDRLFDMWLTDDPAWGWGYIGWSDCYQYGTKNIAANHVKAEEIINRALGEKNLRDRADVVDRAIEIYTDLGQKEMVAELVKELQELKKAPAKTNAPVIVTKIGRNEPCPCGSSKKYKKCCGK